MLSQNELTTSGALQRDLAIYACARTQNGCVITAQLLGSGLSSAGIDRWVRSTRLTRRYPGVYTLDAGASSTLTNWTAAVLAGGVGAALCMQSAARLHGVLPWSPRLITVAARYRRASSRSTRFLRVQLPPADVCIVDNVSCTTLERTLVDLGRELSSTSLARVMHEAAYHGRLDIDAVRAQIELMPGYRGTAVAREALRMIETGSPGTLSALEERVLRLIEKWGLPRPLVNVRWTHGGQRYRLDLWWPGQRVCVEIDGLAHHRQRSRREDEERNAALESGGIRCLRVTPADLRYRESEFRRELTAMLVS